MIDKKVPPDAAHPATVQSRILSAGSEGLRQSRLLIQRVIREFRAAPSTASNWTENVYCNAVALPRRTLRILVSIVVAVTVCAGVLVYLDHRYTLVEAARTAAVSAAETSVVKVLSYNFRSIDRQVADADYLVTGRFKVDYDRLMKESIIPGSREKQVAVQTGVAKTSVVASDPTKIVLLMYVYQDSESMFDTNQGVASGAIDVTLVNENGRWLISELKSV
jgi:Mce-associated membrane protein